MKLSKNVCSLSLFSVSYHQEILGYNIFCSLISKTMFSKTALAEQTAEVISQDVEQTLQMAVAILELAVAAVSLNCTRALWH